MSTLKKAVIDRFEEDKAVLLINEKPVVVLRSAIPEEVMEGAWLEVEFEGDRLISAKMDAGETQETTTRIQEKLAKLRARKKGRWDGG